MGTWSVPVHDSTTWKFFFACGTRLFFSFPSSGLAERMASWEKRRKSDLRDGALSAGGGMYLPIVPQ
jgi:hypothetical protein